jgi:nicotinamide mononucleotide adenylyltransferase
MSQKYLATAAFQSSSNEVKYSMFIGRWQPWHAGHRWLIDQRLNEGKKVLLAIRDVEPDERNPWTPQEVLQNLTQELLDLIQEGRLKIIIIPDIESVNIGRGVGYDVIEHMPPEEVREISATAVRNKMKEEGKL